jgi:hypothetical protein
MNDMRKVQFSIKVVSWEGRTSDQADHLALFYKGQKPDSTLCGIRIFYGGIDEIEKVKTAEVSPDNISNLCTMCKKSAWAEG